MNTEELFRKYPYYIYPAIKALADADPAERKTLLRRIAAGVGPMEALRTIAGVDPEEFRNFYGDADKPELSTDDTISLFIDKFAPEERAAEKPERAEEVVPIAPPVVDYAAMMLDSDTADTADMPDDDTLSMLNAFLGASAKSSTAETPQKKVETPPHQEPLSEGLAKIMVKNGNYRKALEIITEINLKNPKKSIYFADQMRFLRKLIAAQEASIDKN